MPKEASRSALGRAVKQKAGYLRLTINRIYNHDEALSPPRPVTKRDILKTIPPRSMAEHRDWRNFHRYVYHFIYLENGDRIAVGSVSQPAIMSHLSIGYLCRNSDKKVLPIKSSNFLLYQHGENQIMPKDYGFTFTAGGQSYDVQALIKDEDTFYIGKEREAKIHERWATFNINGIKGWGCAEWHYNNLGQKLFTGL
ncbi:hypothetical protein EVAR_32111_1 [Eumeta japonica]|uniref:DUF7064 domain-containing protein n=1 Tax=Eumeta variegata TaxID=151549 RepID=A0A4C1V472_EUMVA|nr:hypothetical protein EVAR_32111_1 [Eumeta japonica]